MSDQYRIYIPTKNEIEFAKYLSDKKDITNKYTVNKNSRIYGFLVEFAFNNFYGDCFEWVGIYGETRFDFIKYNTLITVDCKGKPVKIFPPPLNYHCGLYEIKNKSWAKCDIYVFGAVTDIDVFKEIKVALVGWEYCKYYLHTAKVHKKGTNHPDFDNILKYDLYEKEYSELRIFNGNSNP